MKKLQYKNLNKFRTSFYAVGSLIIISTFAAVVLTTLLLPNRSDSSVSAHAPSLHIRNNINKTVVQPGEIVNLTLTLTNNGDTNFISGHKNMTAYNVKVTDTLPEKLTFVDTNTTTRSWDVGTFSKGAIWEKTVQVKVSDSAVFGAYTNIATVSAQHLVKGVWVAYPKVQATYAIKVVPVEKPILVMEKVANSSNVNAGGSLSYDIKVKNNGTTVAKNVVVIDQLPAGFVNLSSSSNTWILGDINSGVTKSISYVVKINENVSKGTYINTATLTSNNHASVTATANVQVKGQVLGEPANPVLVVTKTANKTQINAGSILIYTVSVKNTGEAPAVNLIIKDVLPSGFKQKGTNLTTIQWAVPLLQSGQTWAQPLEVEVSQNVQAGQYTNIVTAISENHPTASRAEHTVLVKTGTVLGATGVSFKDGFIWSSALVLLGLASVQIRREFKKVKV